MLTDELPVGWQGLEGLEEAQKKKSAEGVADVADVVALSQVFLEVPGTVAIARQVVDRLRDNYARYTEMRVSTGVLRGTEPMGEPPCVAIVTSAAHLGREFAALGIGRLAAMVLYPEATRQLREARELEPGWDSYGAEPPFEAAIDRAGQVVARSAEHGLSQPHVAPCGDGGMQIEWASGGRELHAYCSPDGSIEYLRIAGDTVEETRGTSADLDGHLAWLSGG